MTAPTETLLSPLLPAGNVYLDKSKPLVPQIADDLKCRMLNGQYAQHSPLPTATALGEFYDTTDQTVGTALARLIKEGWVEKEGFGKYRVATIIPPSAESVPLPVAKERPVVQQVSATRLLYCPTCGIWTQMDPSMLAAIPTGMTLACVADASVLVSVALDPDKRK